MKIYRLWIEASNAVQRLEIKDTLEYARRYKENPKLPKNPRVTYDLEWRNRGGWDAFFNTGLRKGKYSTWEEASNAAKNLNIKNSIDYDKIYKSDSFLPSKPRLWYLSEWEIKGGWTSFLGIKKRTFYQTFSEASNAAIALNISTFNEYRTRYKEDPKLPNCPNEVYRKEWISLGKWKGYLDHQENNKYHSWEDASKASISLGIRSAKEYALRYKDDPKLPSDPRKHYKKYWNKNNQWQEFLSLPITYPTFEEASKAAIKLNINSRKDYRVRHKLDPCLPSNPEGKYRDVWRLKGGLNDFLGIIKIEKYSCWKEASSAASKLNINSAHEYKTRYKEDSKLPLHPSKAYSSDWQKKGLWLGFLKKIGTMKYLTWSEASESAKKLGIKSSTEYNKLYKNDASLPSSPSKTYSQAWKTNRGWSGFLAVEIISLYKTWKEASSAIIKFGVLSRSQYRIEYKNDPKLPRNPDLKYKNEWAKNNSWDGFLGNPKPESYTTWKSSSMASIKLNIRSKNEYKRRSIEDPLLPKHPDRVYCEVWNKNGGWDSFLEKHRFEIYPSFDAAVKAINNLSIKTDKEYTERYKEDVKLPSSLRNKYPVEWYKIGGWNGIAAINNNYYRSWEEASYAAIKLGIKTKSEYSITFKKDKLLCAHPDQEYISSWKENHGWKGFLSIDFHAPYDSFHLASKATRQLGIRSQSEYRQRFKEDSCLPSNPKIMYENTWDSNSGWRGFLGVDKDIYLTWTEASDAAQALGFKDSYEYKEKFKVDDKLRSNPSHYYPLDWIKNGSWDGFLMPREIDSLEKASVAAKYLGVTSEKQYAEKYKDYPFGKLPRHPERWSCLKDGEWSSWPGFLGVDFYKYNEFKEFIRNTPEIKNINTYKSFRKKSNNMRLPASPDEIYEEWKNWFVSLGKAEPYQTSYIEEPYISWATSINNFMMVARGANNKRNSLCKFQRDFIGKEELGYTPEHFLLKYGIKTPNIDVTKELINKYKFFLDGLTIKENTNTSNNVNQAACEYLEWVINNKLSEENDFNELIPLVINPLRFANITINISDWSEKLYETNKNILPYHYLKGAREWIIPPKATNFSDLGHLHNAFDSDWVKVEEAVVDKNDPDCIWELRPNTKLGPQYYLWQPISWLHTYALLQTPYRGYQIAYSDSGEADYEIPITDSNRNITWIKNPSPIAGLTVNQGFIKRYPQNEIGTYLTTNKTNNKGAGYAIPWLDEDLAYWIIRLRIWQIKYNPIEKPTPWSTLTRTNINVSQRTEKGSNCFLFRAYGQLEAASFQQYLDRRLAVSLYHIQDSVVELATVASDKKRSASNYKSIYTPHSIRASMITAFLMDFGLPPHIVMKIVGHATIVMTSYYNKPGKERLREIITIGEKKALQRKANNQMLLVQQGKLDKIKNEFTGNSKEVLASLSSSSPAANFTFTDYGFCPFAGTRCNEGGLLIGNTKIHSHVPEGYLGKQNCLQCRFFVTGPAFLGGLLSIANELFFEAKKQSEHMEEIRISLDTVKTELREFEKKQYDAEKYNEPDFDQDAKFHIEVHKNKLCSELERATKKIDMFLCDLNFSHKLINQCKDLVNHEELPHNENEIKLVKQQDFNLSIEPQETTHFHQLSEICSNAEFYESASAKSAIYPRSQMLDLMATLNGMDPILQMLNEKQQLAVGNQMSELLLSRLKSWGKIDKVITGSILLSDLNNDQRITPLEIKELVIKKIGVKHGNS